MPKVSKLESAQAHYTLRIGAEDDEDPIELSYLPSRMPDDMYRLDFARLKEMEADPDGGNLEGLGETLDTIYGAVAAIVTEWNLESANSTERIPLEAEAIRRELGPVNAMSLLERIMQDLRGRRITGNLNGSNSGITSLESARHARSGASTRTRKRKA